MGRDKRYHFLRTQPIYFTEVKRALRQQQTALVVVHMSMAARSKLERWRKRRRQTSCITRDARERERFPNETSQPLPQGVIPALDMSCLTCFLPHCCMLLLWNDCLIGSPKIGVAMSCSIRFWNGFLEYATGLFTTISYRVCHDLPSLSTKCNPDPRLVHLFQDT